MSWAATPIATSATNERWYSSPITAPPVEREGKKITMPRNVNDIIRKLSSAQRKKVEKRAAALIAEEFSLRELRRAHKLTQVKLAKSLGVRQEQISRLEQRSDLLISTLRG
jgi:DNA-binding XRE family transcriptional regulator